MNPAGVPTAVVYYVHHGGEVVYVGSTGNLERRLAQHRRDGTGGVDESARVASTTPMPDTAARLFEQHEIMRLSPRLNTAWTWDATDEDGPDPHDFSSFAEWGHGRRGWSEQTQRIYSRRIGAARAAIGDLTAASVSDLYRHLDSLSPHPETRNQARAALVAWYDWQIELERRGDNPAQLLATRKVPARDPKALSAEQARRVWRAAQQRGAEVQLLVALMLYGGLRVSEALSLSWADVTGERIVVTGKGGKRRTVPMASTVRSALDGVGRGRSGPLAHRRYPWAYREVRRLAMVCGVEMTPHSLRHTAATRMLHQGVDVATVAAILGHSSIATTQVYLRVEDDRARAAVEGLDFAA